MYCSARLPDRLNMDEVFQEDMRQLQGRPWSRRQFKNHYIACRPVFHLPHLQHHWRDLPFLHTHAFYNFGYHMSRYFNMNGEVPLNNDKFERSAAKITWDPLIHMAHLRDSPVYRVPRGTQVLRCPDIMLPITTLGTSRRIVPWISGMCAACHRHPCCDYNPVAVFNKFMFYTGMPAGHFRLAHHFLCQRLPEDVALLILCKSHTLFPDAETMTLTLFQPGDYVEANLCWACDWYYHNAEVFEDSPVYHEFRCPGLHRFTDEGA